MSIIKKILFEASTKLIFTDTIDNRYAFIARDTTKYISVDSKFEIVKQLESLRRKSGKGLPVMMIMPEMLIATQPTIEDKKIRKFGKIIDTIDSLPFVVKLNGIYYLLDGHHRVTVALLMKEKLIEVRIKDLD